MFELLSWLTGLALVLAMIVVYEQERDPLHPIMFFGPLFAYTYFASPLILFYGGKLSRLFPEPEQLVYAQLVFLACVILLAAGCVRSRLHGGSGAHVVRHRAVASGDPCMARRMMHLGVVLGCLGVLTYLVMINNVGGFARAYSVPKGGGYAPSGYIGEGPLLGYPAIVLVAMSARGNGLLWWHALTALAFALPQLAHGTLGGRRGPLFLVLATLFLSYFIARGIRPSRRVVLAGVIAMGCAVFVVWSHRQQIFVGSEMTFSKQSILERLLPKDQELAGDTYIYGAGSVLNARYHGNFGWGKKYIVNLFIRPIPRQIWPTKYEDTIPLVPKETEKAWMRSLGWTPLAGSASGFMADAYCEFGLGCLAVSYLMGLFCGYCWRKSVVTGGVWQIFYMEVLILGIYLPTQSLSAFWYRLLFMGVPTWLVWKHYVIGHKRPAMNEWPSLAVMEREIEQRERETSLPPKIVDRQRGQT